MRKLTTALLDRLEPVAAQLGRHVAPGPSAEPHAGNQNVCRHAHHARSPLGHSMSVMTMPGRMLRLLSLMQGRRDWTGPELAERLGVTDRTVRRDIERLRELGYPVDGTTGTAGGYRLASGRDLPPLLLRRRREALASWGTRSARRGGFVLVATAAVFVGFVVFAAPVSGPTLRIPDRIDGIVGTEPEPEPTAERPADRPTDTVATDGATGEAVSSPSRSTSGPGSADDLTTRGPGATASTRPEPTSSVPAPVPTVRPAPTDRPTTRPTDAIPNTPTAKPSQATEPRGKPTAQPTPGGGGRP